MYELQNHILEHCGESALAIPLVLALLGMTALAGWARVLWKRTTEQSTRIGCLNELLRRSNESRIREVRDNSQRQRETIENLLKAFSHVRPPRLNDLAEDSSKDFELPWSEE
jgi:hypothetical protein